MARAAVTAVTHWRDQGSSSGLFWERYRSSTVTVQGDLDHCGDPSQRWNLQL